MAPRIAPAMILIAALSAAPVTAQDQGRAVPKGQVGSLADLWREVKSGDTVYVLDTSARETAGVFAALTASSITLLVDGQLREIPQLDVRQVARRGDSLWNGFLIGAAFGGLTGALAAQDSCDAGGGCSSGLGVAGALIGAGVWGAIGAGIDALIKGRTVIYRAGAQPSVRLMPGVSSHGAAAALRFEW